MSIRRKAFLETIVEVIEDSEVLTAEYKKIGRDAVRKTRESAILPSQFDFFTTEELKKYFQTVFRNKADYFFERIALSVAVRLGVGRIFQIEEEKAAEARKITAEKDRGVNSKTQPKKPAAEIQKPKRKLIRVSANMYDFIRNHILYNPEDEARDGSKWVTHQDGSKELLIPSSRMSAEQKAEYEEAWRDKSQDE